MAGVAARAFSDVPIVPEVAPVIVMGRTASELLELLGFQDQRLAPLVALEDRSAIRCAQMVKDWRGMLLLDAEEARDWWLANGPELKRLTTELFGKEEAFTGASLASVICHIFGIDPASMNVRPMTREERAFFSEESRQGVMA